MGTLILVKGDLMNVVKNMNIIFYVIINFIIVLN